MVVGSLGELTDTYSNPMPNDTRPKRPPNLCENRERTVLARTRSHVIICAPLPYYTQFLVLVTVHQKDSAFAAARPRMGREPARRSRVSHEVLMLTST